MKKNKWDGIIMGLSCLMILALVVLLNIGKNSQGKLIVVFCNVGQGDAIYLKTPSGDDVLIDGGPNERVLDCLSHYMPFWDRKIEMVIVSHPQADHIAGLVSVIKSYQVDLLMIGNQENKDSPELLEIKKLVALKNILVKNPSLGQKIDFSKGLTAQILWPKKEWLADRLVDENGHILGISNINLLEEQDKSYLFNGDLNQTSTVMLFSLGNFDLLLTGDADSEIQPTILKNNNLELVEVLKVPHHGSKKALADEFLTKIKPQLAVISVGKNSFGHPAKELINNLENLGIKIERTDADGEIKITSDGKSWQVE